MANCYRLSTRILSSLLLVLPSYHVSNSIVTMHCGQIYMFLLTLQTQVYVGFGRVEADLDDIDLDYPNAKKLLADYKAEASTSGWLTAEGG